MEDESHALKGPTDERRVAVLSGRRRFIVPLRMKASYFSFSRTPYFSTTRPSTVPLYISSSLLFLSFRKTEAPAINLCPTARFDVFPSPSFYLPILNLAEKIQSPHDSLKDYYCSSGFIVRRVICDIIKIHD